VTPLTQGSVLAQTQQGLLPVLCSGLPACVISLTQSSTRSAALSLYVTVLPACAGKGATNIPPGFPCWAITVDACSCVRTVCCGHHTLYITNQQVSTTQSATYKQGMNTSTSHLCHWHRRQVVMYEGQVLAPMLLSQAHQPPNLGQPIYSRVCHTSWEQRVELLQKCNTSNRQCAHKLLLKAAGRWLICL
jgi:hypothetical protein